MVKSHRFPATCLQSSPKYDVDLSTTRGGPVFFGSTQVLNHQTWENRKIIHPILHREIAFFGTR